MVQGYTFWREHMIEQMCSCFAFPTAWFWSRSWKRKCVKLLGHILRRPTPSYIRSTSELVIPRTVGKSTVWTDNPSFDLEHREARLKCRWPRFPKNLQLKKIAFDIIKGPACPRHCEGPRLLFLEGAHDWANVFVLCISHCLVLKQVLKEKMRETIGTYSTKTYSKLHSIDIWTGNTKDGWKKHGMNRQPFFWFGTSRSKIEIQMTKIPKESAAQKDSVWYYQGSCMPKTLRGSKAILLGGSTWLSKCVRALHFPWFWSRSWKRKCVKLLGHILRRPTPGYIRYPNW